MNKDGAAERDHVLFIDADREYREGKAQNHLRPEDIDKIVYAYRSGYDIEAYCRKVPKAEIVAEDCNCNIRRYVDNAPRPEPHDVRAHLHGGVPKSEVESLARFWQNYPELKNGLFAGRDERYLDFAPALTGKRDIADFVVSHRRVIASHAAFRKGLKTGGKTTCR